MSSLIVLLVHIYLVFTSLLSNFPYLRSYFSRLNLFMGILLFIQVLFSIKCLIDLEKNRSFHRIPLFHQFQL